MYTFLTVAEKSLGRVKSFSKLSYYKVKYGKRLKIGKGVHFKKDLIININRNGKVEIGDGTYFNSNCSINCHELVKIGKNNLFGEGVKIYDHNHVFNDKTINMGKTYKTHHIVIGDKNWFGSNVVILSKARVGDNNVFGANVVVNSEYGSDSIIKNFTEPTIEKIQYKVGGRE